MAIRTLIFDLGKVIVDFSFDEAYRRMRVLNGLDADAIRTRLLEGTLVADFETGRIQSEAFVAEVNRRMGTSISPSAFAELWSSIFHATPLIPETLLSGLRASHRLVLLSNTNPLHFGMIQETYPHISHFDSLVLSHEVGAMKPQPAIYRAALAEARCEPQECLFFDDLAENVEGARAVGINAEHLMRTLVIDNHDSFTFNLVQLIAEVNGIAPLVVTNDEAAWADLAALDFDNIVISPGPGRPERVRDFGVCRQAIELSAVPLLGVCLGHQGLVHAWGGEVVYAPEPMHGRLSAVYHDGRELFGAIPQGFNAVRYHSLAAAEPLPACLERTAWTMDGVLMGLRHRTRPQWGVQFHPESIATEHGALLLKNFRNMSQSRL